MDESDNEYTWTTTTTTLTRTCVDRTNTSASTVNCVLIEDTFVVSGSADKTIRKWDMATCGCVAVLEGHENVINRIICTGDFIFSSSYDRTARCWDFESGECLRVFRGHKRGVYPLIFVPSPDDEDQGEGDAQEDEERESNGDILVTGAADCTAIAWSFETAEPLMTFKEHAGAITCMALDPTGKILLTGATDFTVRSWDLKTGESLKVFEGHTSSVVCMTVRSRSVGLYTRCICIRLQCCGALAILRLHNSALFMFTLVIMHLYSSNNMIAKQTINKKKNSKRAATTLHNKVYRTITRHL